MSARLLFQDLLKIYKKWVISNPNLVTDVETAVTWSSYFVAGKINKSPIVSELIYSLSKLLSLFNDRLIREAYSGERLYYGLREQIQLYMTLLHYSEVFVELFVRENWGARGKWTVVTLLQLFKCTSSLLLLYRFKDLPISHPPVPALHRKKFVEGKETDENSNSFFTLRRSGRVIRRVEGAPAVAFRDWEPLRVKHDHPPLGAQNRDLLLAESMHVIKPLIHLCAMKVFGTKSWQQWLIALGVDVGSLRLYSRSMNDLNYIQRLEIGRRKLGLVLYLLRSPMYNNYSHDMIQNILQSAAQNIPMMSYICGPIIQYLSHWQEIYFYMWSS